MSARCIGSERLDAYNGRMLAASGCHRCCGIPNNKMIDQNFFVVALSFLFFARCFLCDLGHHYRLWSPWFGKWGFLIRLRLLGLGFDRSGAGVASIGGLEVGK